MIKIVIPETTQVEIDETAYLLSNSANKDNLLKVIANVENLPLVDVDLDSL